MYAKIIGLVLLMVAPAWAQLVVPGGSTNTPGLEITVTNLVFGDDSHFTSAGFTNNYLLTNDPAYVELVTGAVFRTREPVLLGPGARAQSGYGGYGIALGEDACAAPHAVALGNSASGSLHAVALGYRAKSPGWYGISLGYSAFAEYSSDIAIGESAEARGGVCAAIGAGVINEIPNSTATRGNLYLDGGEAIYYRSGFGSGTWTILAAADTNIPVYVETDPVWLAASTNYATIADVVASNAVFDGYWAAQRLTNAGLQASIATNAYEVALKLSTADWEASDPYTNYVRRTGDILSGSLDMGRQGITNVTWVTLGAPADFDGKLVINCDGSDGSSLLEVGNSFKILDNYTHWLWMNGEDRAVYVNGNIAGGAPELRLLGDGDGGAAKPLIIVGTATDVLISADSGIWAPGFFGDGAGVTNIDPSSFAVGKVYAAGDGSAITNITGLVSSNYLDKAGGEVWGPQTNLGAVRLVGPVSEGLSTSAVSYGHAEGYRTTATGSVGAHSEGNSTVASGNFGVHAEGSGATASGDYGSHAEGFMTVASGSEGAHSEGVNTTASGDYGAHAEGYGSVASGSEGAHAGGKESTALGKTSFASGYHAAACDDYSFVWSDDSAGAFSNCSFGPASFNIYATNGIRLFGGAYYGDGRGLTNLAAAYLTIASFNATITNYFKYVNEAPTSNSMPTVGRQIRPLTLGSTNGLAFYIPEYCDKWMFVPAHTNW